MNYTKKLMVEPGAKVRLAKFDPAFHGKVDDEHAATQQLEAAKQKIGDLQRKMYGDNRHSLLIVLQGLDAAGKDGVCWHVVSAMDPQGCKVQGFKAPTAEELAHDFLWRVHPHAPAKGEVAVFNRSHYEDVLVARVHKLVPKKVWERRYDLINDWERLLVEENGTTILKFCLVVSKEEQLRRFAQRLDDPHRQWKISDADYKERGILRRLPRGVRRRPGAHLHAARALVHDSLRQQVVPQSRGRRNCPGCAGRDEAEVPRADRRSRADPARVSRGGAVREGTLSADGGGRHRGGRRRQVPAAPRLAVFGRGRWHAARRRLRVHDRARRAAPAGPVRDGADRGRPAWARPWFWAPCSAR